MCAHKQAVTVAEMARMVGLSRSRFYQLVGSAFPFPIYDLATKRPYYTPDLQQVCLEVRQTNRGIDGKPVLFHRREVQESIVRPARSKQKPNSNNHRDLLAGLKSLGMAGVTAADVDKALKELQMPVSQDQGKVLRAVFLKLKHQDTSAPVPKQKPEPGE